MRCFREWIFPECPRGCLDASKKGFFVTTKRVSVDISFLEIPSSDPLSSTSHYFPKTQKIRKCPLACPKGPNNSVMIWFPAFKNPSWMDHLPGCLRYTIDVGDPEDRGGASAKKAVKQKSFKHQFCHRKISRFSATFFMCTFYRYILLYMHIYIFMTYVFRLSRHNSHGGGQWWIFQCRYRRMDGFHEFAPMMWGMTSFCKFHARKKKHEFWGILVHLYLIWFILWGTIFFCDSKFNDSTMGFWRKLRYHFY